LEKFEYKVIRLPIVGWGIFKKDVPANLQNTLNAEGANGWRLVNSNVIATGFGESNKLVCIFMREAK
jgi:hypothetical protein